HEVAARNPDQEVVVRPQALCEFADPQITEARTPAPLSSVKAIEVAPDSLNQFANVTRACVTSLCVGRGEHVPRATRRTFPRFFVMEPRSGNDGFPQAHRPNAVLIEFNRHAAKMARVTC